MGTAHCSVSPAFYEELLTLEADLPLTILRATDFGDGTMLLLIESSVLPEGYHGVQDLILDRETHALRFKMDLDV
jgi:hypothetical protein